MEVGILAVSEMAGSMSAGKYAGLARSLRRYIPEIREYAGGGMAGWRKRFLDRVHRRGDPTELWWRKERSALAYRAKSLAAERRILADRPGPDLCLQVLHHFCPFAVSRRIPYVIYLDYSMAQARERWPEWTRGRSRFQTAMQVRDEHVACRHAEHLFSFTENTRAAVIRHARVAPERITTVGFSGRSMGPCEARRFSLARRLLFAGEEFGRKGGPILYEAMRRLRRERPEIELAVLGGDAPEGPENVRRVGRLEAAQEIDGWFRWADAFVLPSLCDPSPLVLVEAMSHGLPCIATAVDGIPEIVADGETGTLIPPGDALALCRAIVGMLDSGERMGAMSEAGVRRVKERFAWDTVADRVWAILRALPPARILHTLEGVEDPGSWKTAR